MNVGRYMTRNPITATPETTHPEAMKLMRDHDINRLPVMEDGKLIGIVVEEDLLSTQPSPATTLSIYEIYALLDKLTLRTLMASPVITVSEDCPLEEAARIMLERDISALPIMNGEALVGIITETDIFRALVEALGGEEQGTAFTVRLEDKPGALASVTAAVAKAGGNIAHLVTLRRTANVGEVYIKEQGADQAELERLIDQEALADVISFGPIRRHEPVLFGKKK